MFETVEFVKTYVLWAFWNIDITFFSRNTDFLNIVTIFEDKFEFPVFEWFTTFYGHYMNNIIWNTSFSNRRDNSDRSFSFTPIF